MIRTGFQAANATDGLERKFAIRFSSDGERSPKREKWCRDLKRLGGMAVRGGFAFLTADRRSATFDMLCDNYGERYFETFDRST